MLFLGDPDGNRTRVTAVKGRCLSRLTTGPFDIYKEGSRPPKAGANPLVLKMVAAVGFEPTTLRV